MQHVALRIARGVIPGEHAFAVGNAFAGAFFQAALVYEEFVADDAGEGQTLIGRVGEGVAAGTVFGVQLNGHHLFEAVEFVFDVGFVPGADDDDVPDAFRV